MKDYNVMINTADEFATTVKQFFGGDSIEYKTALSIIDSAVEREALCNDRWTEAEQKAMIEE